MHETAFENLKNFDILFGTIYQKLVLFTCGVQIQNVEKGQFCSSFNRTSFMFEICFTNFKICQLQTWQGFPQNLLYDRKSQDMTSV